MRGRVDPWIGSKETEVGMEVLQKIANSAVGLVSRCLLLYAVVGEWNGSRRQDVQRKLYRCCTEEVCFFVVNRLIARCVLVSEMVRKQALMPNAKDR